MRPGTGKPSDVGPDDPPRWTELFDLPDPLLDAIFAQLGLSDLAAAGCTSWDFLRLSRHALRAKTSLTATVDLPLLPRAHNLLLMGGGSSSSSGSSASSSSSSTAEPAHAPPADCQPANRPSPRSVVLSYLPHALHFAR